MGDLFSYTRLQEHAVSVLPWYNGERSVKGDPRKTVKWIDVSGSPSNARMAVYLEQIMKYHLRIFFLYTSTNRLTIITTGSPWNCLVLGPRHPYLPLI